MLCRVRVKVIGAMEVVVPDDVVRVRVHPSVTVIPGGTFRERYKLEEVELCDDLLEIGKGAFCGCMSLKRINIPSTVTTIRGYAFTGCKKLTQVDLCEGLLEIGKEAFMGCQALQKIIIPSTVSEIKFFSFYDCKGLEEVVLYEGNLQAIGVRAFSETNIKRIKIPSSVTVIDNYAFAECYKLAEVELCHGLRSINIHAFRTCITLKRITIPTTVTAIKVGAFDSCKTLRDLAIPLNAEIGGFNGKGNIRASGSTNIFSQCTDLKQLFDTEDRLINALKHRFDNLPIHKTVYYEYNNVTVEQLDDATSIKISQRRSKLNPTGSQQDCLGMTPLHIMACSTAQNIQLYRLLVDKYPKALVTEDRWGAVPLLYAVWRNAPMEIVDFLVERYQSLYPNHEFNWTQMMATLSKAQVRNDVIRTLFDLYIEFIPNQVEEWIDELAEHRQIFKKTFRLLVQHGYTERVNAIGLKKIRDEISARMNKSAPPNCKCKSWLEGVRSKLSKYEKEYNMLKEATTLLELALWKYKMDESESSKKRKRTEKSDDDFREQCRIGCGADIVIGRVLPFLMPALSNTSPYHGSDSDESSSSSDDDNESSDSNEIE